MGFISIDEAFVTKTAIIVHDHPSENAAFSVCVKCKPRMRQMSEI